MLPNYISIDNIRLPSTLNKDDLLEVLNLPVRLRNALVNHQDITTVGQFFDISENELLKTRNLGRKTVDYLLEVRKKIKEEFDIFQSINIVEESQNDSLKGDTIDLVLAKANISTADTIDILNLPAQIENALKNQGIETVVELFTYPEEKLQSLWFMGPKSAAVIIDIKNSIKKGFIPGPKEINIAPNIPNDKLIEVTLNRCADERSKDVIKRRYGIMTGERETLEEISRSYGVTRERIRQLEARSLKKMRHSSTRSKIPLTKLVENIFLENGGIISSEEADRLITEVIKNCAFDGSSLLDLISDLGWIQKHSIGDISFYCSGLSDIKLSELMEKIVFVLKKNGGLLDLESIIRHLPPSNKIEKTLLSALVLKCCNLDPRIEEKIPNKFTLYSNHGRTKVWVSLITQVLEEESSPLHFTEISNRFNDLFVSETQHIDHRRVYAILVENRIFAHTGIRGTYGLTKWGLRKDSTIDLVSECINKAGFPLHFEQIYSYISKYKDSQKVSIRQILETSGKFEKKGNGIYGIKHD